MSDFTVYGINNNGEGKYVGKLYAVDRDKIASHNATEFTAIGSFDATRATRIQGLYRLRSAEGRLDLVDPSYRDTIRHNEYELSIKGTNLGDLEEMHDLIRAGKIHPYTSYEEKQLPSPARQLKETLREAWGIIRREIAAKYYQVRA